MKLCIACNKEPAILSSVHGYLPCASCGKGKKTTQLYEFAQDSVKESRKKYAKDIIQSSRDGVLSKERLEAYGTKGLKVTQEQIDSAEYTWGELEPYRKGNPKNI